MTDLIKSGVYIITCMVNGKHYIGFSGKIRKRLTEHKNNLRKGIHKNSYLQDDFTLHSEKNFTFEELELYPVDQMASFENWWCNELNTHNREFGYNVKPTNPDNLSLHSQETKDKISKLKTGFSHTTETKIKMSKNSAHRKVPVEEIEAGRLARIGTKHTDETKRQMSVSGKGKHSAKRKPLSEEAKLNISKSKIGVPSVVKGRKMSTEVIEINRLSQLKFTYSIKLPDGTVSLSNNLKKFCNDIGLHSSNLKRTFNKDSKPYNGYKLISIEPILKAA